MATADTTADTAMEEVKERFSPGAMARRLARGELGSLRVIFGIAVIWTIFQIANDRFLSAINLTNLTLQIAAVATISIGVVLVLCSARSTCPSAPSQDSPRRSWPCWR